MSADSVGGDSDSLPNVLGQNDHRPNAPKRGRPVELFVRQFYTYDEDLGKSKCLIDECGQYVMGNHKGNLERHIFAAHPIKGALLLGDKSAHLKKIRNHDGRSSSSSVLDPPVKKRKTSNLTLKLNAKDLVDACVEIVSVNGRPLSVLHDSGFRKILDPILEAVNKALPSTETPVSINRKNIGTHVSTKAEELRKKIREEVRGKLVSLKTDTVTRLDRQLLGVNIQFIQDGKICLRNLAVKELFDSHTAQNLKAELEEVLDEFGLTTSSLYSGTTDNALNMLKTVAMMDKDVKTTLASASEHEEECSHAPFNISLEPADQVFSSSNNDSFIKSPSAHIVSDSDSTAVDSESEDDVSASAIDEERGSDTEDVDDISDEHESPPESIPETQNTANLACPECAILKKVFDEMGVQIVRCSAHTLQLAVEDALEACKEYHPTLSKARKLCKMLRISKLAAELKKLGCNKILTEVVTRWHSLYDMLLSLLKARIACSKIEKTIKSKKISSPTIRRNFRNLSSAEWAEVEELCETLKPARTATKILQREQLTVGDFYGAWLDCKLSVKRKQNDLAEKLVKAMETREEKLLSSPIFSAAIYLDPRYKVLLSEKMVTSAKNHLLGLWHRLNPNSSGTVQNEEAEEHEEVSAEDTDPVEQLLREAAKAQKKSNQPLLQSTSLRQLSNLLNKVETWPRLPRDTDILEFWEKRKNLEPELYKLLCVVMAVPMTQVSVERSFSHLRQVLSILRYSLSPELIKDIMLIRCNAYFQKDMR